MVSFCFKYNKFLKFVIVTFFRATNAENMEMNKVKNQLTGKYDEVPATARYYKVQNNSRTNV